MTTIHIGLRLIALEHVALVEPFDPASQAKIESERPFQTRIVLLDRESVLTEQPLPEFAEKHGFRMMAEDGIAISPDVHFNVEEFAAKDGFNPTKPYKSRLLWRDQSGGPQSKLLLSPPEEALAIAVRGEMHPFEPSADKPIRRVKRSRRRRTSSPKPT